MPCFGDIDQVQLGLVLHEGEAAVNTAHKRMPFEHFS